MPKPVSGEWVDDEFAGLANAGLSKVVSLLETQEAKELSLADEKQLCEKHGLAFEQFSIKDRGIPKDTLGYLALVKRLLCEVEAGGNIAVHCRAGIGRAGMLATSILVSGGLTVDAAFAQVSAKKRISVPDTEEQIEFIHSISAELS